MTSCCAPGALAVWWLDSFWKIRAFLDGHQAVAKHIVTGIYRGRRGSGSSAAHSLRAHRSLESGPSWSLLLSVGSQMAPGEKTLR